MIAFSDLHNFSSPKHAWPLCKRIAVSFNMQVGFQPPTSSIPLLQHVLDLEQFFVVGEAGKLKAFDFLTIQALVATRVAFRHNRWRNGRDVWHFDGTLIRLRSATVTTDTAKTRRKR